MAKKNATRKRAPAKSKGKASSARSNSKSLRASASSKRSSSSRLDARSRSRTVRAGSHPGRIVKAVSDARRPRPIKSPAPSADLGREFYQGKPVLEDGSPIDPRGIGADAGGQSGDLQGLSEVEDVESESVEELVEEGQDYEAEIVAGIERAGDTPDAGVPRRERKDEFEPETEEGELSEPRRRGRPKSSPAAKNSY